VDIFEAIEAFFSGLFNWLFVGLIVNPIVGVLALLYSLAVPAIILGVGFLLFVHLGLEIPNRPLPTALALFASPFVLYAALAVLFTGISNVIMVIWRFIVLLLPWSEWGHKEANHFSLLTNYDFGLILGDPLLNLYDPEGGLFGWFVLLYWAAAVFCVYELCRADFQPGSITGSNSAAAALVCGSAFGFSVVVQMAFYEFWEEWNSMMYWSEWYSSEFPDTASELGFFGVTSGVLDYTVIPSMIAAAAVFSRTLAAIAVEIDDDSTTASMIPQEAAGFLGLGIFCAQGMNTVSSKIINGSYLEPQNTMLAIGATGILVSFFTLGGAHAAGSTLRAASNRFRVGLWVPIIGLPSHVKRRQAVSKTKRENLEESERLSALFEGEPKYFEACIMGEISETDAVSLFNSDIRGFRAREATLEDGTKPFSQTVEDIEKAILSGSVSLHQGMRIYRLRDWKEGVERALAGNWDDSTLTFFTEYRDSEEAEYWLEEMTTQIEAGELTVDWCRWLLEDCGFIDHPDDIHWAISPDPDWSLPLDDFEWVNLEVVSDPPSKKPPKPARVRKPRGNRFIGSDSGTWGRARKVRRTRPGHQRGIIRWRFNS